MKKLQFIGIILLLTVLVSSDIINIPDDQTTIQAGIDEAVTGDTVLVQPGTYYENIDLSWKVITLASLYYTTQDTNYILQTIIDGNQNGRVVRYVCEEESPTVLAGFTIINGYDTFAGGINCYNGNMIISGLRIVNNSIYGNSGKGAGIFFLNSESYLENVIISNNTIVDDGGSGGGLFIENSDITMNNVSLSNNHAYIGGGLKSINSTLIIDAISVYDNSATHGGGLNCSHSTLEMNDVVISGNQASFTGGGLYSYSSVFNLNNVQFVHNSSEDFGGAMTLNSSELFLADVVVSHNEATDLGGGFYLIENTELYFDAENRSSVYQNHSGSGNDFYATESQEIITNVVVDLFTISNPTSYHAFPIGNYTFDIQNYILESVFTDVYVSPFGDNGNDGQSWMTTFRTINHALSVIQADSDNPLTIHIAQGTYSPSATGEQFPLTCSDNIHLSGQIDGETIINAGNENSVFFLENVTNIDFSNLIIKQGFAREGAGIYCENSDFEMVNMKIQYNASYGNHAKGGGLYCINSTGVIANSIISGNTAESEVWNIARGAGIYCSDNSDLTLLNVTLANNIILSNGAEGDGIYCTGETDMTIINSIVWGNDLQQIVLGNESNSLLIAYTDIEGGEDGIESNNYNTIHYFEGNINTIPFFTDSAHSDYSLLGSSSCIDAGTAFFEWFEDIYLNLSEDEYFGLAPDMGAIEYENETQHDSFIIVPTEMPTIQDGIYAAWDADTLLVLPGTYLENIDFLGKNITIGSLFLTTQDSTYINQTIIDGNTNGSVVIFESGEDSTATLCGFTVTNGSANHGGGVVCKNGSSPNLTGLNVINNYAVGHGGGIRITADAHPRMRHLTIQNNTANYGAGVYCSSENSLTLKNVFITNNNSNTNGAGIYITNSDIALINCEITNNTAVLGGGIFCSDSELFVGGSRINNNIVADAFSCNGGGVYSSYSNIVFDNTVLGNNSSDGYGGGLYAIGGDYELKNSLFFNNNANYGGGLVSYNADLKIMGCTFSQNSAFGELDYPGGGGICSLFNSSIQIVNSIFWENIYPEILFLDYSDQGDLMVAFSNIDLNEIEMNSIPLNWLDGNIDENPLFEDSENGNFLLTENSPCIDVGTDFFIWNGATLIDLQPDEYFGIAPDLGAFEFDNTVINDDEISSVYSLFQNYPNPFNPTTTISFNLTAEDVMNSRLEIYNLKGQKVKEFPDIRNQTSVIWNGEDETGNAVSSGIYFYKLNVNEKAVKTKKMILLK